MMQNEIFDTKVFAKLNLSLAITGKRGNLHTLDMIVYPYDKLCDEVRFYPNDKIGLEGLDTSGYDGFDSARFYNENCQKLDEILRHFDVGGRLEIVKNIPLGAGMGGSSAVYAGVVKVVQKYLCAIKKNTAIDAAYLLTLGSDVPCVYYAKPCRVRGVGEDISPLEDNVKLDFDIIVAKGGSDSAKCYKLYDEKCTQSSAAPPATIKDALDEMRNDLFEPACMLNDNILLACNTLKSKGYEKVMMSGSGSTVFGVKVHNLQ